MLNLTPMDNCTICGDRRWIGQSHECWLALKMIEQDNIEPEPGSDQPALFDRLTRDDGQLVINPPPYINSSGVPVSLSQMHPNTQQAITGSRETE